VEPHLERQAEGDSAGFDRFGESYESELDRVVSWAGQDVDVYAGVKAEALLDLAASHLDNPAGLTFLDVGCGTGSTDRHLAGRVRAIHGVDISNAMVERARAANPSASYRVYDGASLPFESDAVDVSFAICVAHHVPPSTWPRFFGEMSRVTRCGGIVVVAEHNPYNPVTRAIVNRCAFDVDAVLLTPRTTRRLLVQSGLEHVETRHILFAPWRTPLVERAENTLRRLPLGAQYLSVGRRVC
jgi:SAM-dependent methyltransferase